MSDQRMALARRAISGSAIILGSQVITMLTYFLAQRLILSTLTKEANGILFAERRMVDLLIIMVADCGLNIIAMRKTVQSPEKSGVVFSSIMALRLVLLVPVAVAALTYGAGAGFSLLDVGLWLIYCVISNRVGVIRYLMEIPYRTSMKFIVPAASSVLDAVLFATLLFVNRDALSPTTVIICFVLGAVPGFLFLLILDRGQTYRPSNIVWAEIRALVVEALPVFGMIALVAIHDKIDAVMLNWWSSEEQLGIFGAAYVSLAPITSTIPIAVTLTIMPVIARLAMTDHEESMRYIFTTLRALSVVALLASAVLSILAPDVIQLVSKGRYADNALHFGLFLWMSVPIYILAYAQEVVVALGHSRKSIYIGIALAVSTIVAGTLLIPTYAALGATIGKVISVTVGSVVALLLLRSIVGHRLDVKYVFGLSTCLAAGVAGYIWLPTIMPRWWAAATNGVLVLAVAAVVGILRRSDVQLFRSVIGSHKSAPLP